MGKALNEVRRLAGSAIGRYGLIAEGDRILIAISGGKDSLVMAHTLHTLQRKAPVKFELECATFDPGFPGFGLETTERYCRAQGWRYRIISLPVADWLKESDRMPCVLCSRLRRGKLYGLAEELGCGKLALGQHLDDIERSFLISIFRGQGLTTMGPRVRAKAHPVEVIRPLALTPEALIRAAAQELSLPEVGKCTYSGQLEETGDRAWAGRLLASLEERIPEIRQQLLHSLGKVEVENLLDVRFLKKT